MSEIAVAATLGATATAARVLAWAAEASPAGPVPAGPLWEAAQLARPPDSVRDAAVQLAQRTAARLGAGSPPFGSRERIGPGALFLAAAAGGRQQAGPAARLARAVPPAAARRDPGAWYDLVARHGVVAAVVTALDGADSGTIPGGPASSADPAQTADDGEREPLPEVLLDASPLTTVLYRPTLRALRSDTTGQAVTTAVALLSRPRGRAVLAAGLAGWTPLPHVLGWRAGLLSRFRHDHRDLLLDVYLTARTRHAADWDQRIAWAARQLSLHGAPDPLAIDTLRFWAPLAAIERDAPLSRLRPLLSGQDRALTLVRRFRLDQAGAA
jgi:hypothetical protein